MISPIQIVQGDTLPILDFAVEKDGAVVDLTGAEVVFSMKDDQGNIKVDKEPCDIASPATAGICQYQLEADDTNEAGTFKGEIQITFPGGRKQTSFDDIAIVIKPQVA